MDFGLGLLCHWGSFSDLLGSRLSAVCPRLLGSPKGRRGLEVVGFEIGRFHAQRSSVPHYTREDKSVIIQRHLQICHFRAARVPIGVMNALLPGFPLSWRFPLPFTVRFPNASGLFSSFRALPGVLGASGLLWFKGLAAAAVWWVFTRFSWSRRANMVAN